MIVLRPGVAVAPVIPVAVAAIIVAVAAIIVAVIAVAALAAVVAVAVMLGAAVPFFFAAPMLAFPFQAALAVQFALAFEMALAVQFALAVQMALAFEPLALLLLQVEFAAVAVAPAFVRQRAGIAPAVIGRRIVVTVPLRRSRRAARYGQAGTQQPPQDAAAIWCCFWHLICSLMPSFDRTEGYVAT